ncbi:hypothetical protein QN277_000796 [Acacia crassicarpa]|uniref:DDE Tnp4 domain-containing protein n=1 Tax=Acacia crassicarpa TaxID=499986 RepID=A0AAE1THI6_9FABA|nr:hypothetical protein QN277_000796 [Acacia crassicarpa]
MKSVFPHPPEGKYYVVDVGYLNMKGYLAPFEGERYHILDFRGCSQPHGLQEVFNHAHSSIRNVIERKIGVWKNKWHILPDMKPFSLINQEKVIIATIVVHKFSRKGGVDDEEFDKCDLNLDYILKSKKGRNIDEKMSIHGHRRIADNGYMDRAQNQIASTLMENRNR